MDKKCLWKGNRNITDVIDIIILKNQNNNRILIRSSTSILGEVCRDHFIAFKRFSSQHTPIHSESQWLKIPNVVRHSSSML